MSGLTSRTLDGLQVVLLGSLVGNTITGTHTTVALVESDDFLDPGVGPVGCVNGGVVVSAEGGSWTRNAAPKTEAGGKVQRMWAHRFLCSITIDLRAAPGGRWTDDALPLLRQCINLIEATLEPGFGSQNYTIGDEGYMKPTRHPNGEGFLLLRISVTINEPWNRG